MQYQTAMHQPFNVPMLVQTNMTALAASQTSPDVVSSGPIQAGPLVGTPEVVAASDDNGYLDSLDVSGCNLLCHCLKHLSTIKF